MIISDVRQHPVAGYWMARISDGFVTYDVDKLWGSWQIVISEDGRERRQGMPVEVAIALQEQLPASERGGRRRTVASTADGARYGRIVTP